MSDSETQRSLDQLRRDAGALYPEQLSDGELQIIAEIECRLEEGKGTPQPKKPTGAEHYLKRVEERHSRALLIEGGRGTGKTSLLLTLVERWHHRITMSEANAEDFVQKYSKQFSRLDSGVRGRIFEACGRRDEAKGEGGAGTSEAAFNTIPGYIRVLDILDFDPLPPGMPFIAAIMQAWRPLAEEYDRQVEQQGEGYDEPDGGLMDRWYRMFHTAAAGWGRVSNDRGLIEQVLDRQDQVQHWQRLSEDWQAFVWKVLECGRTLKGGERLANDTVFVIMIDDCDLQVERIRQLLPAIRMLYHPRVYFLVAADPEHMREMLELDFFGQQRELARNADSERASLRVLARGNSWAVNLAQSSFDKVFPLASRWRVKELSLLEFLAFPKRAVDLQGEGSSAPSANEGGQKRFIDYLNELNSGNKTERLGAGAFLLEFANGAGRLLPGVMTYRQAQHLLRHVKRFSGREQAAEILARLVSQEPEEWRATVWDARLAGQDSDSKQQRGDSDFSIEVRTPGEVATLYRPGLQVPGTQYDIYMSARPDFVFTERSGEMRVRMSEEHQGSFNFTRALIAKALDEAKYPVDTSSLAWNTYVNHIWTEWSSDPNRAFSRMAFRWPLHEHPRPDRLLRQTGDWQGFINKLNKVNEPERERQMMEWRAYAWIYFQRSWSDPSKWSISDPNDGLINPCDLDRDKKISTSQWRGVLNFSKVKNKREQDQWVNRTIPLMARPEIGLPWEVQEILLEVLQLGQGPKRLEATIEIDPKRAADLKRERERLITDAIFAARAQEANKEVDVPSDQEIADIRDAIDDIYAKGHEQRNPWKEIIASRVADSTRIGGAAGTGSA